jgi:hypothetical protein
MAAAAAAALLLLLLTATCCCMQPWKIMTPSQSYLHEQLVVLCCLCFALLVAGLLNGCLAALALQGGKAANSSTAQSATQHDMIACAHSIAAEALASPDHSSL